MAQVYEKKDGDSEKIDDHLKKTKAYSDRILVQQYNRMTRLGLMDVHTQKLYVLSLHIEFLKRFDRSPIIFEDNIILRLTGQIDINFLYNT